MSGARNDLGYVAESDVDLVLLLDARACGPMTARLFERVGLARPETVLARRSTSRCGASRETDVEISWSDGVLFVEDKVDARFTPGQPQSYAAEVREQRALRRTAAAVLVCPTRHMLRHQALATDDLGIPCFDAYVTCAELADVAEAHAKATDDPLARGTAMVMRAAEEPRPPGSTAADPARAAWGDGYRTLVAELVPPEDRLTVGPRSLRTATADAACFPSAGFDPPSVWSLAHLLSTGEVRIELMLDGTPRHVPDGVKVIRKKRMTWLTVSVPPVHFESTPAEQRPAIEMAVQAALKLRRWAWENAVA